MILEQYDREPWGILRPDHVVKRRDGFPETVVFEFSEAVIRETARLAGGEIAGKLISAAGTTPIYKINYKGRELGIGLYRSRRMRQQYGGNNSYGGEEDLCMRRVRRAGRIHRRR